MTASSKAQENELWKWLSKARMVFKDLLHLRRVENSVGSGMPDVNGCLYASDFWIELKSTKRPARASTPIRHSLQSGQEPWARARRKAGGRAFVLIQVGSGAAASRYLLTGEWIKKTSGGLLESKLEALSLIKPDASAATILEVAARVAMPPLSMADGYDVR